MAENGGYVLEEFHRLIIQRCILHPELSIEIQAHTLIVIFWILSLLNIQFHVNVALSHIMEALTALSVASSVIQFVDFGCKLLSQSRQLYKSAEGILTENVDIEILTQDLINMIKACVGYCLRTAL